MAATFTMAGTFLYSSDELMRELGAAVIERALVIVQRNGVRGVQAAADGSRMTAVVLNEERRAYHQTIALSRASGNFKIKGYCTCPIGLNCKHVAAVLLERLKSFPKVAQLPSPVPALASPQAASTAVATFGQPVSRAGLDRATQAWLDRIELSVAPPVPRAVTPQARHMFYVLEPASDVPGVATVRAVTVSIAKDGTPRDERLVDIDHWERLQKQGVKYLTDADTAILRDLAWVKRQRYGSTTAVHLQSDVASLRVLAKLLATGRLRARAINGAVLSLAAAVSAEPKRLKHASGHQQLVFVPSAGAAFDAILALDPPHYLRGADVGPITTSLPASLALEVVRAPMISPTEAALVKDVFAKRLTTPAPQALDNVDAVTGEIVATAGPDKLLLPLPDAAENIRTRQVTPQPRLRLFMGQASLKDRFKWYADEKLKQGVFSVPLVDLTFDYDGETVAAHQAGTMLERIEGDALVLIPRKLDAEAAATERLRAARFVPMAQSLFDVRAETAGTFWLKPQGGDLYDQLEEFDNPSRFLAFSADEVPRLIKAGWQVSFEDAYPYQIATGEADWWADTGEGSGIQWFSFELGITFEGQRINIVPQLASLLTRLPKDIVELATKPDAEKAFARALGRVKLYANLPDGRLLPLPSERLAPILRGLLELIGPRGDRIVDGRVKLHRAEAAALAGFADLAGVAWAASAERLLDLGKTLRRGKALAPVKPPANFKASLRDYQLDGLAWLDFLRDAGFGGVLADDMGLGKTVQGLAFLAREKAAGRLDKPALILAPTSVLPNWQAEAERFAPNLTVLALRGLDRHALFDQIPTADIVLTTYPLLARDHAVLLSQEFHVAMLDEAQAIKNPKANVAVLAHQIKARHRFALTGTPLENNLGEVWSLFEFLSPGLLGDESTFKRTFRTPIEKHGDQAAQGFLSRRLKPFMLRRTKQEVAKELPPKTEIVERIQLEGAQRDLYETVRVLMEKRVREEIDKKGLAKSHIIFLDALLKLRQICCDPRLLKMDAARKVKQSAKLERLMELVPEMVAEGRRILIFSQFTSMLDLIEAELNREKIGYVRLTGQTTDRSVPVKAFQTGKVPVFLLSLKAGGTGLNLTAADTVIHYDPWWNPAVENQATDRAYRIGQDKPVFVHKLIVEDGIEDAIELLKAKKAALANALFEGSSKAPMQLTEADIAALFAPLDRAKRKLKAA
jgi:superfamily II DNA or RNA helicase